MVVQRICICSGVMLEIWWWWYTYDEGRLYWWDRTACCVIYGESEIITVDLLGPGSLSVCLKERVVKCVVITLVSCLMDSDFIVMITII